MLIRASQVALVVKKKKKKTRQECKRHNETWIQSLGWEDPLEKGLANHSSTLAWRIPMDRGAWWATVHEVVKSQTCLSN